MKWLHKLEYKHGKHYIHGLMTLVVIGMAVVYVLQMVAGARFNLIDNLTLNRDAIFSGQVWRLITFIFVPQGSSIWLLVSLYFYYTIGKSLENSWGGFRFNLYYFVGMLGAIIAAMLTGYGVNTFLNLSLFLAFASLAPDTSFMLFFILPVKAKWMALAYGGVLLAEVFFTFMGGGVQAGVAALVSLLFSLLNYFLFFGTGLIGMIQNQMRIAKNRRNWRR